MLFNIPTIGFTEALIIFLVVILSVTVHEYAHAFVANLRGDPTAKYNGRLTLNPIAHFEVFGFLMMLFTNFGWGKPVPVNPYNLKNPKTDNLLVALSGPLSNFLIAFVAGILLKLENATLNLDLLTITLLSIVTINIGLGLFNLLPFPPLDGSNIYKVFLPERWQYILSNLSIQSILIIFGLVYLPLINGQSLISFILSPLITHITALFLK